MNDKKKEEKKQEVAKTEPRGPVTPFERFGLMTDFDFFRDMDRFFDEYMPRRWWRQMQAGWPSRLTGHGLAPFEGKTPSVDVINREGDFLVKVELPGVKKEDIQITMANNVLTLEAKMSKEEKEEKGEYYRREICSGSYRRIIELPEAVKEDGVKATFSDGILELIIPKQEKTKRSTITIK